MYDVGTNFKGFFSKKGPLRVIAVITLWSFLFTVGVGNAFTGYSGAVSFAEERSNVRSFDSNSPGTFSSINVESFTLPEYLGNIKDFYKAETNKVIIHIQDAHCNYEAQHKVSDIIGYIKKEYGIPIVNLEGGSGRYDLSVFSKIPDSNIRKNTLEYFLKKGILNGAEFYAGNNLGKISLWGIESTKVYLENLNVYRNALPYKKQTQEYLNILDHYITNLKAKIFSDELIEIDKQYIDYKSGDVGLKEYISYLFEKARQSGISIKKYPNLFLMKQSLEQEEHIDFKSANDERELLIEDLKRSLSKKSLEELVHKTLEFRSKKISQKTFYDFLLNKARLGNIAIEGYKELQKYIIYIATYSAINKSEIMNELDRIAEDINNYLYEDDEQRKLNELSKNLTLTKNLYAFSLTKQDYDYYKENENSFKVENYLSFINKIAPKHNINPSIDENIKTLDIFREQVSKFYGLSFQRDEEFLKNIKYSDNGTAVMVSGGFHTDNLCELFKEQDISYVSVIPNFKNPTGYVSPYFKLLAGDKNALNVINNLSTQLYGIQIQSFLAENAKDVLAKENIDAFKLTAILHSKVQSMTPDANGEKSLIVSGYGSLGDYKYTLKSNGELIITEATEEVSQDNKLSILALCLGVGETFIDEPMARRGDFSPVNSADARGAVEKILQCIEGNDALKEQVETLLEENYVNPDGHGVAVQFAPGLNDIGQEEHAGGWGVSVRSGLSGQQLKRAIIHGILAGIFSDHAVVDSIENLISSGKLADAKIALSKAVGQEDIFFGKPLWCMSQAEREDVSLTKGRDMAAKTISSTPVLTQEVEQIRKQLKAQFISIYETLPQDLKSKIDMYIERDLSFESDAFLSLLFLNWKYNDSAWWYDKFWPHEKREEYSKISTLMQLILMDRTIIDVTDQEGVTKWKNRFNQNDNRSELYEGISPFLGLDETKALASFKSVIMRESVYGYLSSIIIGVFPYIKGDFGEEYGFKEDDVYKALFEMSLRYDTFDDYLRSLNERIEKKTGLSLAGLTIDNIMNDTAIRNQLLQAITFDLMDILGIAEEVATRLRRSYLSKVMNRSEDTWADNVDKQGSDEEAWKEEKRKQWTESFNSGERTDLFAGNQDGSFGPDGWVIQRETYVPSFIEMIESASVFGRLAIAILYNYATRDGFFGYETDNLFERMYQEAEGFNTFEEYVDYLDALLETATGKDRKEILGIITTDLGVREKSVEIVFNYFMKLVGDSKTYLEFFELKTSMEKIITFNLQDPKVAREGLSRKTPWQRNNLRLCNGFWPNGPEKTLDLVSRGIGGGFATAFAEEGLMAPTHNTPAGFYPLSTTQLAYGGMPWSRNTGAIMYFKKDMLDIASSDEIRAVKEQLPNLRIHLTDKEEVVVKNMAQWDALEYMFISKSEFTKIKTQLRELGIIDKVIVIDMQSNGVEYYLGNNESNKTLLQHSMPEVEIEDMWHFGTRLVITQVFKEQYLSQLVNGVSREHNILKSAEALAQKRVFTPEELASQLNEDADIVIDVLVRSGKYALKETRMDGYGKRILILTNIQDGQQSFTWEDITAPLSERETRIALLEQEKIIQERVAENIQRRYPGWRMEQYDYPEARKANKGKIQTISERKQAIESSFARVENRGRVVKTLVGVPVDAETEARISSTVRDVNRSLAKNGFSLEKATSYSQKGDRKQIITFSIYSHGLAPDEMTKESAQKALDLAIKDLQKVLTQTGQEGHIVFYVPEMDEGKGPKLQQSFSSLANNNAVTMIPDAYNDANPSEKQFIDIEVRVALARHVASYQFAIQSGHEEVAGMALDSINELLRSVNEEYQDISSIEQLLELPLRIKPINYESIREWAESQKAVDTSL